MFKAAYKNLLAHKLRMLLTGFSIVLGVSFISGTYIFTDSISSTFNNLFTDVFSGIDVTVRPKQEDFGQGATSFSDEVLETVKNVDGVAVAAPEVFGLAQFLDKEGNPIGGQGPPTLGFSWTEEPGLSAMQIKDGDGRGPEMAGEVLMDKGTALKYNFALGDKVQILVNGPAREFTIVGFTSYGEANNLAGATLAVFQLEEAQQMFGYVGQYSAINTKAVTGVSPEDLQSRIAAVVPEEVEAVTGQQQSDETLDQIGEGLGFINTALLAFAGISIFVGAFIIQNTFRIIVAQRSKELALLRAIGATKSQVIRLVLYEATIIALFASAVGILLGFVISAGVRALMNSVGFTLPTGPLTLQPRTIAVSMAVGVLVTLISALLPAIRASRVSPVEAMRENEASSSNKKSLFKRGLVGTIIIVLGAGALIYGLGGSVEQPIYLVGFGVAFMFIGVSVIAPLLSIPLVQILSWPLVKTRGIPAKLANGNAKRTPRRTASSAAALMIGVSLVALLSILATTFKSEITSLLDDSFPGDLGVSSQAVGENGPGTAGFSISAYNTMKELPELTDVTALRYEFEGAKINDSVIFIAAVDVPSFGEVIELSETEGSFEGMAEGGMLVSKKVADAEGWSIGQEVTIEFALTGATTIKIAGTFDQAYDSDYLISTETYLKNFENDNVTLVIMNAADGVPVPDAKVATQKALEGYPQLEVQDKEDLFERVNKQIDQILSLFWALLGFAVIIAVLGITNTLMLSISERTKEIGMLRAIGMTRPQIRRMIRYESIVIALFGSVLGIVMGAFFAWAVLRALESEGITGYVVPFGQIAIYFVLAIIAGIFAAAWPARKAARMDVLKAIYHD